MVTRLPRKPTEPDIVEADVIEELHDRVEDLSGRVEGLESAFPDKTYAEHAVQHAECKSKEQRSKAAKDKWIELRNKLFFDIAGTLIKGLLWGMGGLFMLGVYTKFNEAVNKAIDQPRATTGSTK